MAVVKCTSTKAHHPKTPGEIVGAQELIAETEFIVGRDL
jgi:hypothetical protein